VRIRQALSRQFLFMAAVMSGCSAPPDPIAPELAVEAKLRDVGELCRVYQMIYKAPPKSIKDLTRGGSQATPGAFAAIGSGAIVLRYGAMLPATDESPGSAGSDEVLAYLKKVPTEGGLVLMLNREIRTITAEDFKAAKLAGKSE
jgi:hypothetical protein